MDKFPILWKGKSVGELILEKESLYTWFTVQCHLPESGLWCAWVIGEKNNLRLGVLEPTEGHFSIRRRYSDRLTVPLGKVLRGEVRFVLNEELEWDRLSDPDKQIRAPWLRNQIKGKNVLVRFEGEMFLLAFPYDRGKAFPLVPLFCFAEIRPIREQEYVVFAFDQKNQPVFQSGRYGIKKGPSGKNS